MKIEESNTLQAIRCQPGTHSVQQFQCKIQDSISRAPQAASTSILERLGKKIKAILKGFFEGVRSFFYVLFCCGKKEIKANGYQTKMTLLKLIELMKSPADEDTTLIKRFNQLKLELDPVTQEALKKELALVLAEKQNVLSIEDFVSSALNNPDDCSLGDKWRDRRDTDLLHAALRLYEKINKKTKNKA